MYKNKGLHTRIIWRRNMELVVYNRACVLNLVQFILYNLKKNTKYPKGLKSKNSKLVQCLIIKGLWHIIDVHHWLSKKSKVYNQFLTYEYILQNTKTNINKKCINQNLIRHTSWSDCLWQSMGMWFSLSL